MLPDFSAVYSAHPQTLTTPPLYMKPFGFAFAPSVPLDAALYSTCVVTAVF